MNTDMQEILQKREETGVLRKLTLLNKTIDFTSNDYLGFARSEELSKMIDKEYHATLDGNYRNGSGGSRLLSGNSAEAQELEAYLARVHNAKAALLFSSGYDANIGLFSSMTSKEDIIIYDELVHASIHDGIRLSRLNSFPFRHNDLAHLEERLVNSTGPVFVAVESVYSMDGDCAPLKELNDLCVAYNAKLIVDEAHATGVFGKGLVQQLQLENDVYARINTFGKALGCHGAVVLGTELLKDYLVNFARSFIYTTALPLHSLVSIKCAYQLLEKSDEVQIKLHDNIAYFRQRINPPSPNLATIRNEPSAAGRRWLDSISAIQGLILPGNSQVKLLCEKLHENDIDVRPILHPTVQKGKERIRICLHSYNTSEQIDKLFQIVRKELL